jgi:phosphatidylserine/phosphatidylglycerophosphate/cardiolipin synthase-like enzyme
MINRTTSKKYSVVFKKSASKGGVNMSPNTQTNNSPICVLIDTDQFIGKLVDVIQRDSSPVRRGILQKVEGNFVELIEGSESRIFICCNNIGAIVRLN